MPLKTRITELLGIKHPIFLAGMNVAAGPELAAAVTNAGGIGVIGGVGYTPKFLKQQIDDIKAGLNDKSAPFGVDLLLPQVGDGARATNKDYTEGKLGELIDIICASGAKLFVCAVGVPPRWAVDKLHAANILVMNMIGAPKHVKKALDAGVDIICAQGSEGGGHTGDIATTVLIPQVVDCCRGKTSPRTGEQVLVVAAGGIFDGRGLAAALAWGASGVWVGTRFIASPEAAAPDRHKNGVLGAQATDTVRTLIYSGRPVRTLMTPYVRSWEEGRQAEIRELCAAGKVPMEAEMKAMQEKGQKFSFAKAFPMLMGQCAGPVTEITPAAQIVVEMVEDAAAVMAQNAALVSRL